MLPNRGPRAREQFAAEQAPVPEMVARGAPPTAHVSTLGPGGLTRPIVAALPAGYRPRPAAAMIEILQQVSERWRKAAGELVAA